SLFLGCNGTSFMAISLFDSLRTEERRIEAFLDLTDLAETLFLGITSLPDFPLSLEELELLKRLFVAVFATRSLFPATFTSLFLIAVLN
ncbi:hypothetical protein PENTCL1PPCAC_11373, partial [Pristionchus entomophagus]